MKKFIKLFGAALMVALTLSANISFATGEVESTFARSASGTTSATAIVPPSDFNGEATAVKVRLDAGVTTGLVRVLSGAQKFFCTSATSASTSVIWFANTNSEIGIGDYLILADVSASSYSLLRCKSATTTSVTVQETISQAQTTSDVLWVVDVSAEFPVLDTTSRTENLGRIWIPAKVPTAFTVDGNTTACRIAVSGNRSNYK